MNHLPGKVGGISKNTFLPFSYCKVPLGEKDSMISTVDRNKDGKISYSEFRWVRDNS